MDTCQKCDFAELRFYGYHHFRNSSNTDLRQYGETCLRKYGITTLCVWWATGHGFRSTASTILNENEFRSDVIERKLAHGERNKGRAANNYAQ